MIKVITFLCLFTSVGLYSPSGKVWLPELGNRITSSHVRAADKLWHGKKAAVVLTYDDALEVQLDNVIPALDSLGFKGSFYLTADFAGSKNRIQDWRKAAANGHELGNHTLFHPCDASKPGRSWVSPSNDLSKYNTGQIVREIEMTNIFLESLDGKKERTFAYTCGDTQTGEGSFVEKIKSQFISMRGVRGQINKLETLDLNNIDCFVIDNNNAGQLVTWAEKAKEEHGLMVVLFHGVGGGHPINTDRKKHNDFLKYLKNHPDDFWVTTMLEASKFSIQDKAQVLLQSARDSIAKLSAVDHEQMKKQLGITIPNRPGPSGNPTAPNAANRFEAKVNPYTLPDPLLLKNGKPVKTEKDWWEKRRPEIVEDFDREIYGRLPKNIPGVTWKVVSVKDTTVGTYPIKEKTLRGVVDNSSFPKIKVEIELVLATPAKAGVKVPVVLEFGFIRWPFGNNTTPQQNNLIAPTEPGWKEQLISRGWGYAILNPTSIQADNGAGLIQGIIGLVNKGAPRKPDDWGALRAWAWGASRASDYFETDKDVDAKRLAIEGLSRYGKATVVAMAFEPRFSLAFIGSSGAGGTKLLKRVFGEQVENLASSGAYHWFCGNFIKYGSSLTPEDLPVDAHELIALCAPRPVFISSGSPQVEGQWVDAKGMFLGGVHAGPVYKLLGKKDLGTSEFPILGTPLVNSDIAFRQHAGGHSTGPNWSTWIAWACKYWGDCKYF